MQHGTSICKGPDGPCSPLIMPYSLKILVNVMNNQNFGSKFGPFYFSIIFLQFYCFLSPVLIFIFQMLSFLINLFFSSLRPPIPILFYLLCMNNLCIVEILIIYYLFIYLLLEALEFWKCYFQNIFRLLLWGISRPSLILHQFLC